MADAGSQGPAPDRDADWLLYELGGKHRAQVLSTLAAVGVPDALQQRGVCDLDALASHTGCDRADLESLVRAAAGRPRTSTTSAARTPPTRSSGPASSPPKTPAA